MSDGAISQDEIDALLSGVNVDGLNSSGHVGNNPSFKFDIPTLQKFAEDLRPKLEENINQFTGVNFVCDTPVTESSERDKVLAKFPDMVVVVSANFKDGIRGEHLYFLSPEFALKICEKASGEESPAPDSIDEMVLDLLKEFFQTHIAAEILQLSTVETLNHEVPQAAEEAKAMIMFPQGEFALISYPLTLDGNAYTLWECIGGDAAEGICKALGGGTDNTAGLSPLDNFDSSTNMMGDAQSANMNMGGMAMGGMQNNVPNMNFGQMPNMGMQQQMNAMPNMGMPNMGMPNMGMPNNMGVNMGMNVPNIQQLSYPTLQAGPNAGEQGNISLIMDVFMEMTVELGRTKKSIKEILGMGEGTIIELDKLAGEPVDILVNHKPIAKGEVVVIDENFGVRVTEILSPMERVNDLQ